MSEVLTIEEIRKRHDGEWVLILNPETSADRLVVKGTVAFHSLDRDEVDRKLLELRPNSSADFYFGDRPTRVLINQGLFF